MRFLVNAMVIAGLLFTGHAIASTNTNPCHNFNACFAEIDRLIPSGDLSDYPQVAISTYGEGSYAGNAHRFPKKIPPMGNRIFMFSPRYKAWAAYDASGSRVGSGKANGGAGYCADIGRACRTPRGLFRVHSKGTADCVSNKFPVGRGGAPMPFCMFFHGGYAIHGSPGIGDFNSSHGCIRVTNRAAAWLHENFINHGTRVLVLPY